jgi:hypothetical protein
VGKSGVSRRVVEEEKLFPEYALAEAALAERGAEERGDDGLLSLGADRFPLLLLCEDLPSSRAALFLTGSRMQRLPG